MDLDKIIKEDYSLKFDEIRKALVTQSHFKYGKASRNFATGNVDAVGCMKKCLAKFEETGNTEFLADVANFAMIEFMYPQKVGAKYTPTDGTNLGKRTTVGISVNEMKDIKEGNSDYWLKY